MEEFKNKNVFEETMEEKNTYDGADIDYTWYDDEYKTVMSGTIADERALSLYKPKVKKIKKELMPMC